MSGRVHVFRGRRVITPEGERAAAVHVRDGTITAVTAFAAVGNADTVLDVGDAVLLPGLVDTHVHMNDPGRTEWEGFETGTRAAAAGGVTTIVDMPLNSVPATTSVAGLAAKVEAARNRSFVDVAFWGGAVPGNERELSALAEAGVRGFKCFLVPSGIPEFRHVGETDLRRALDVIAELRLPLLAHAELPGPLADAAQEGACRSCAEYAATRPPEAEVEAVALLIRLAEQMRAHVHVVHVAAAAALPLIRAARARGIRITAETCPHYLHFSAEEVPEGATEFKCAPPIRDAANRDQLWRGLQNGTLDMVVSDHSPCPPELKTRAGGDFQQAWGGISSLQLGLAVTWTGARARGFALTDVARWMAAAPAQLAGLGARKGTLAPGCDADMVAFDPDTSWTVDPARLHHRHALTPYAGARLTGRVLATYLRGAQIYAEDAVASRPQGRLLLPEGAAWTSRS